eukprot:scaffold82252_cov53-Phaeocystis_antarctica.AAC.2
MSGNAALDDSLALLQNLQDTAERSWRAYQEEEERHNLGPQPDGAASAGSPAAGQSAQLPGEALLTPPTKAPGEGEAQLQLSALQRKLAAVWRQDLSGPSDASPLRLRASPPISGEARTSLPPASIKSPNRLLSPLRLGAGAQSERSAAELALPERSPPPFEGAAWTGAATPPAPGLGVTPTAGGSGGDARSSARAAQLVTPSGFHPLQATPSEPRELVRTRIALRRAHGMIAGERRLLAGAVERLAAHATHAAAQAGGAAGGAAGKEARLGEHVARLRLLAEESTLACREYDGSGEPPPLGISAAVEVEAAVDGAVAAWGRAWAAAQGSAMQIMSSAAERAREEERRSVALRLGEAQAAVARAEREAEASRADAARAEERAARAQADVALELARREAAAVKERAEASARGAERRAVSSALRGALAEAEEEAAALRAAASSSALGSAAASSATTIAGATVQMLGRSLAETEAREAEAARSAAAPTLLRPPSQPPSQPLTNLSPTSFQPPRKALCANLQPYAHHPAPLLLLQVQREAEGFSRQLEMEQAIATLEEEARAHCAALARADERGRELLDDAANARHELQRAQEAAAEEKRRQQRHLRRAQ